MNPGDELIWGHDFSNRNIAAVLGIMRIRTYGELANCGEVELSLYGISYEELADIKRQLDKRGLCLNPD